MLRRALRTKNLNLQASASRYHKYFLQGRRLPGQNPGEALPGAEQEPEGHYFQYMYDPEQMPDMAFGYSGKLKDSPYYGSGFYSFDNWQFEYPGQWWDIAGIGKGGFFMLLPFFLAFWGYYTQVRFFLL